MCSDVQSLARIPWGTLAYLGVLQATLGYPGVPGVSRGEVPTHVPAGAARVPGGFPGKVARGILSVSRGAAPLQNTI